MENEAITESPEENSSSSERESSSNELPDVLESPKPIPKAVQTSKSKSKYKVMILEAVKTLNERKGSSRQAILKYIFENYEVDKESKATLTRIRSSLAQLVEDGVLINPSGRGTNGSFKLASVKTTVVKKSIPKDKPVEKHSADSTSDVQKPPTKPKRKATLALKPKSASVRNSLSAKKTIVVKRTSVRSKISAKTSDIEIQSDVKKIKAKKLAETTEEAPVKKVTKPLKANAPVDKATTSSKNATIKARVKVTKSTKESAAEKTQAVKSPKKAVPKKSPKKLEAQKSPKKGAPKKPKGGTLSKKSA